MVIRLLIATAFSFVLLAGCSIEKKINKAKHLLEDSGALAELCADAYPVRDSIVLKDSVHFDTLVQEYIYSDTITIGDTIYITREVPKLVTKTVFQTKEVYRENTARVAAQAKLIDESTKAIQQLLSEVDHLKSQIVMTKKDRNKWRLWCLLTWFGCGVYLFRKPLFKLIKTAI